MPRKAELFVGRDAQGGAADPIEDRPSSYLPIAKTRRAARRREEPTILRPHDAASEVTLVVFAWTNVDPGVLGWVFPTQAAAINAARALRNAVTWAVVSGRADVTESSSRDDWSDRIVYERSE